MPMLNSAMLSSRSGWLIWAYVVRMCWTNVRIVEGGVVVVVDGGGELVSGNGEDEAVGSPRFARGNVDGA